jgi:hypothetical protein
LNPRPLGYEPHDARLLRLGQSLAAALTSAEWQPEVVSGSLRLLRLSPSRSVRFTNRFTEQVLVPGSHQPCVGAADHAEPLRPELEAPLGCWPSSQLDRCAGGRDVWRLSGGVAVLDCCTVPGLIGSRAGRDAHSPTFRFSGRPLPKSSKYLRASRAVAGRCRLPLVAAVAVTVAVSSAQVVRWQADPDRRATGPEDRKRRGRAMHRERVTCVGRGFTAHASFRFTSCCCWWWSLAADGDSGGISAGATLVIRMPGTRWSGARRTIVPGTAR